jgi:polyribonucleotide nucleotidyltransferase
VGYKDGNYLLNPSLSTLADSQLDLVVAGTENAVLMVESEAAELSEEVMLGAVTYGHEQMQAIINAIRELVAEVGTVAWDWTAPESNVALIDAVKAAGEAALVEAYQISDKQERYGKLDGIRADIVAKLCPEEGESEYEAGEVKEAIGKVEKAIVRGRIIAGEKRIDGRDTSSVRPISVRVGVLPRTHGSALFTRGETQALVVTTLGTARDAQVIDAIEGERKEHFMLHYNFPPYCVGETGFVGSPKRRGDARRRQFSVLHSRGIGDHRVQRFQLHGLGVRFQPVADGCRCAAEGAGGRYRHGPDQGRRPVCRAVRHPR